MIHYSEQDYDTLIDMYNLIGERPIGLLWHSIFQSKSVDNLYVQLIQCTINKRPEGVSNPHVYRARILIDLMFETPLENMPLIMNELKDGLPDEEIRLIANWRLKIGK